MALFVFVCDFVVDDQFLGVIAQRFPRMLEFDVVELLSVDEFIDFCD